MSYKREQFIENLDDILQDIKEIFILDRGGCILLNYRMEEITTVLRRVYRECRKEDLMRETAYLLDMKG